MGNKRRSKAPRELMLRVEAVMKRVNLSSLNTRDFNAHEVIEIDNGGLKVDITARIVYIDDKQVDLSPKEYELLFYLILNRNIALSRDKLICEVWGYDFYGDARTLDTHIKLLRKSLGRYSELIVTLRGIGYRFDAKIDK